VAGGVGIGGLEAGGGIEGVELGRALVLLATNSLKN
jgi:hypothetical protein